jgi:hypothetical protein
VVQRAVVNVLASAQRSLTVLEAHAAVVDTDRGGASDEGKAAPESPSGWLTAQSYPFHLFVREG